MKNIVCLVAVAWLCGLFANMAQGAFVHPGALSTQADLDRMAAKVAANAQPWKGSWDKLVSNTDGFLSHNPLAVQTICAGGNACSSENYTRLMQDAAKAYQCALRYHGSGDTRFANKAVQIMNAWASTHTAWAGDSNISLRAGLYGYQFACAAELMRGYSGWAAADFAAFKQYMLNRFYHFNRSFLDGHNGTCDEHYWANWELANMASALAIAVLCDDQAKFDHALNYFYTGVGNGRITSLVWFVHPNGLGQWQESGRDQGHTLMGPQLLGTFCEIAWNQGYDLYSHDNNRVLASVEYISKYNTGHDVPFRPWKNCDAWFHGSISSGQRGSSRPGWDLIYNHYVNRMGLSAPYTGEYAAKTRPEGGGFNYGTPSWGFDSLGFTTLTHSRDPIASGAAPSALRTTQQPWQVTLSWAGSAYATSYNVKRSTTSGGPYTTIATVGAENLFYVDPGLTARTTYYYVVSANTPGGESANSAQASVIAVAAGGTTTQAENVTRGGTAAFGSWTSGHRGTGWVVPNTAGYVQFNNIDGGAGGMVTLAVRYAIDQPNRTGVWTINGVPQSVLTPMTAWWDWWDEVLVTVPLNSGPNNTIRIESDGTDNYAYLDELTVKNSTAAPTDTIPSAPGNLSATLSGSQIALSWNAVSNARSYNIKRATSSGGPFVILDNVTSTNFNDSDRNLNLNDGTVYYYVVTALNRAGESGSSSQAVIIPPPSNLTAAGSNAVVTLGWNASASGLSVTYNIFRSTTAGGPYSQIATGVATNAFADSTAFNGMTYYYVVTARITSGDESAYSNEAWAIPAQIFQGSSGVVSMEAEHGVLGARWITGTNASASNGTYIEVNPLHDWAGTAPDCTSPDCIAVYRFNIPTSGNYQFWFRIFSGNAADDSFFWRIDNGSWNLENNRYGVGSWFSTDNAQVDSLSAGNHVLQIAYRENGTRLDKFVIQLDGLTAPSGGGPVESLKVASGPAAPTNLKVAAGDGSVALVWVNNSESNLAGYKVYRSTSSGGGYSMIAAGMAASAYTDNTVTNGTAYYYVVTAVNTSSAESAFSNERRAIPGPVYQESGGFLSMEAEHGALGARWTIGANTNASNGAYIEVAPAYDWAGSIPECMSPDCIAVYNFNISMSGNYRFWFRMFSGNAADDSFFWRIDNGSWNLENTRFGIGSWFSTDNAQVDNLSAGSHVLEIAYRENGTRLDKFVIQLDALATPAGGTPVPLTNPGFESPNAGKISVGFDGTPDVPGWNSAAMTGSGVEAVAPNSGAYRAFAKNGDGPFWQTTTQAIAAGDAFTLNFYYLHSGGTGTSEVTASLTAWDGSEETQLASQVFSQTSSWTRATVELTVPDTSTDGQSLRIKFENTGTVGSSWIGLDDVTLSVVTGAATAPPAAPVNLAANGADGLVFLNWDDAMGGGVTSYNVHRGATAGGPYSQIATGVAASDYVDVSVTNGTFYYYVVTSVGGGGESTNSAQVSAQPVSSVPPQVGFTINGSDLQLTWPAGHTGWQLEAQTNAPGAGIGTNWFPVPGSAMTNWFYIPLDTSNGSVFYRLVHP